MINYIWFVLVGIGIIFGMVTGNGESISKAIVSSTESTVELTIKLVGMMCLWCGIMRIAKESGITSKLAKILRPILKIIFKEAAKDEKTLGPMVMNLTSNMMGLSNAATPFGIKTMQEMDRLNNHKDTASDDMILFLIINATCVQFVPTSVISIRVACDSTNPGIIVFPAIIATGIACIMGIIYCKILQRYF